MSDNVAAHGHLPGCMAGELPAHARCTRSCCPCICDRLSAVEARVFVDRTDHWNAALDAAMEAVEGLPDARYEHWVRRDDAIAAIAALKASA